MTEDKGLSGAQKRRNTTLMNWAAILMWFSMYSYVPILPAYSTSLGADAALIGIIGGVYGILQIVLRVGLGFFADRFGRDRLLLIVGFGFAVLSALMFVMTDTLTWVIAARTVAGAASAWWAILSATYAKYQNSDTQIKGQGILSFAANAGKVLAALACAIVAQYFGYHATFFVALAAAAAGLCIVCALQDPQAEKMEPVSLRNQLALFKRVDLIVFCILALISQMVCFALPSTFTLVIAEDLGADNMQLGLLQVVYFAVVSITSLVVVTRLYRKLGGIWTLTISFFIGALSCIPVFYENLLQIYLMQVLSGICYGVTLAILAGFVVQAVPPGQRGGATGIFQSLYAIGIFLGPVLAGTLVEYVSFETTYWVFTLLCVACGMLCPLLIPRKYAKMG